MAGAFEGKRALVLGVANKRSIAWAIAQELAAGGARLAFTFQGERIEKTVRDLAGSVGAELIAECDVRSDDDVARVFREVGETFGGELAHALLDPLALVGEREPRATVRERLRDRPRDRALVRDAQDECALAREASGHWAILIG